MRLHLVFTFVGDDPLHTRTFEYERIDSIGVQDYVFNGKMAAESALVVKDWFGSTAYELAKVCDIVITVRR